MDVRLYDLATCTCSISAAESTHEAMSHYLSVFEVSELDRLDLELAVSDDAGAVAAVRQSLAGVTATAIRRSHPEQRYRVWTTDNQQVLVPEQTPNHVIMVKGNRVQVTAQRRQVAATIGVRIVRQLIMRGGEARGGQTVHAGAVSINGDGVLVGGRPGAGKTSVMTRLVEDHGARAIANDRTTLIPADAGSWRAVGVPLAWRFTPEGIYGSPRRANAVASRTPNRGRDLVDGKVELTPMEVGWMLDSPTAATTRITRVVILVRVPDDRPTSQGVAFVRQHLDFGAADFFADDWLGIRPQFARHVTQPPEGRDAWWAKLAASLPVQVVSWTDPTELPQVAASVAGRQL